MSISQSTVIAKLMAYIYSGLYKYVAGETLTNNEAATYNLGWEIQIVQSLPVNGGDRRTFYFKRGEAPHPENVYDVYIWVELDNNQSDFEEVGQVSFDMRNHYTTSQLNTLLNNYRNASNKIPLAVTNYEDDLLFARIRYVANNDNGYFEAYLNDNESSWILDAPEEATNADLGRLETDLLPMQDFDDCLSDAIAYIEGQQNSFAQPHDPDYSNMFKLIKSLKEENIE